jgi:hypothetical protein
VSIGPGLCCEDASLLHYVRPDLAKCRAALIWAPHMFRCIGRGWRTQLLHTYRCLYRSLCCSPCRSDAAWPWSAHISHMRMTCRGLPACMQTQPCAWPHLCTLRTVQLPTVTVRECHLYPQESMHACSTSGRVRGSLVQGWGPTRPLPHWASVHAREVTGTRTFTSDDLLHGVPTLCPMQTWEAVGSGVVWDAYGHVVTNYHCISKAKGGTQVRPI